MNKWCVFLRGVDVGRLIQAAERRCVASQPLQASSTVLGTGRSPFEMAYLGGIDNIAFLQY